MSLPDVVTQQEWLEARNALARSAMDLDIDAIKWGEGTLA